MHLVPSACAWTATGLVLLALASAAHPQLNGGQISSASTAPRTESAAGLLGPRIWVVDDDGGPIVYLQAMSIFPGGEIRRTNSVPVPLR